MKTTIVLSSAFTGLSAAAAFATVPVPGPVAGTAFGPAGLAVAVVGYLGYRMLKSRNSK